MTAAATDGSSFELTSVTLAILLKPDTKKPAIAASSAETMYSTSSTCQLFTPDRRAAIGLSPSA